MIYFLSTEKLVSGRMGGKIKIIERLLRSSKSQIAGIARK